MKKRRIEAVPSFQFLRAEICLGDFFCFRRDDIFEEVFAGWRISCYRSDVGEVLKRRLCLRKRGMVGTVESDNDVSYVLGTYV